MVAESVLGVGDRLINTIGDAVLLTSADAVSGIGLVLRLFDACETDAGFPELRAGLHSGPVVERAGDIFGATVNIAARVAARAAGGQVLVTRPIADAAPAAGVAVRALGPIMLHNLTTPVEVFRLVHEDMSDRDVDPVCRMRINCATAVGCLTYAGVEYLFCSLDCAGKFAARPDRFTTLK
jgi:adenylate cyclase